MKRVLMLLVVMMLCGIEVRVRADIVEVSSFLYLKDVINSRGAKTICFVNISSEREWIYW
ncbi:MAG: hypothetical protein LBP57_05630 [Endomicrobium sp.]|jgi:hypothetical protein|nr:hypothetical protein [Endomicrobium sp.]